MLSLTTILTKYVPRVAPKAKYCVYSGEALNTLHEISEIAEPTAAPIAASGGEVHTKFGIRGALIIVIMAPVGVEAASHVVAALASEQRLQ